MHREIDCPGDFSTVEEETSFPSPFGSTVETETAEGSAGRGRRWDPGGLFVLVSC